LEVKKAEMLRQIEFIKHPVAPTFPGQNSFVVKPGQKAKYAGKCKTEGKAKGGE
jgi:hypothetical protein